MKINFIYPLDVDPTLPKLILISLGAGLRALNTLMLESKVKPTLKKLKIVAADIPTRVSYSPLTGEIKVSRSTQKHRHRFEGVLPNVLLALGMGYYDFGLSPADRMFWKNLTRTERIDKQILSKSSFNVDMAGKPRLLFGTELLKHLLLREKSLLLEEFFYGGNAELITLSQTRYRGLGLRQSDKNKKIRVNYGLMESQELSLSDALDVTGITGITDQLRAEGFNMKLSHDSSGVIELEAFTPNGQNVLKMKRYFFDGAIKNEYFVLQPVLQRKGLGMSAFVAQLSSAIKHDIKEIHLVAERDEETGLFGYDVWWRFGFDGLIHNTSVSGDTQSAKEWWRQAVVEKIISASQMTLQVQFYGTLRKLEERVRAGEFSPSAYQYFMDVKLEGDYDTKKAFIEPSKKDFMALIDFFNVVDPESRFLKEIDLSYNYQRIQRLMELDGFADWWKVNGGKWSARLDLSDGYDSPAVGLVRNYLNRRRQ